LIGTARETASLLDQRGTALRERRRMANVDVEPTRDDLDAIKELILHYFHGS
jgi:hypothetical protein